MIRKHYCKESIPLNYKVCKTKLKSSCCKTKLQSDTLNVSILVFVPILPISQILSLQCFQRRSKRLKQVAKKCRATSTTARKKRKTMWTWMEWKKLTLASSCTFTRCRESVKHSMNCEQPKRKWSSAIISASRSSIKWRRCSTPSPKIQFW